MGSTSQFLEPDTLDFFTGNLYGSHKQTKRARQTDFFLQKTFMYSTNKLKLPDNPDFFYQQVTYIDSTSKLLEQDKPDICFTRQANWIQLK